MTERTRRSGIKAETFAKIWSEGVTENKSLAEIVEDFIGEGHDVDAGYVAAKSAQVRKYMLKVSEGKTTLPKLTKRDRDPVDVEALLGFGEAVEVEADAEE